MTVFDFSDYREFIRYRVSLQKAGKLGRRKSSISRIAKELGYSTPTVLSMVIHGKRIPSEAMCETMGSRWKLSLKEREYFRLLVQVERQKRSGKDPTETWERLRSIAGKRVVPHTLRDNEFAMISEWHYLVIKQLAETSNFQEDPAWISRALRRKISPRQAQLALSRMLEMGILKKNPNTGRLSPANALMETTHEIPSVAIRLHQKGMIERALEALEEQGVEDRFFNTLTFNLDRKKLPELKKTLLAIMKEVGAEHSDAPADSVFQLNLQLFEHIAPPNFNKEVFHEKN